ncbi:MAG: HD-GYP domain-containing protein [Bacillota bacterium]
MASLKMRKREISMLKQMSGIDPRAVNGLLQKIKKHHHGVCQHSLNVARLSAQLAHQLALTAVEVYIISIGALLHDIGKISLPHAILDKQGKLNEDEWALVKKHPQVGVSIVSQYDWAQQLEPMILLHHERLDRKGYFAVSPQEIPLFARIITLTDAFDAMVSPRPYQGQRDVRDCWEEIERCSGTQFDPDLLQGFYSVITRR